MTEKHKPDAVEIEQYLPTAIYRLRIIAGIGLAIVAAILLIWIVSQSNSLSGDNIVTLFATLITFLTFVFLTIAEPISKPRATSNATDLAIKIGASITLGVLANIVYGLITRR